LLIWKRRLAGLVRHLDQLQVIDVMSLQGFVPDVENHSSVSRRREVQPINVALLEERSNAVGEALCLKDLGPCAVGVESRAGSENGYE